MGETQKVPDARLADNEKCPGIRIERNPHSTVSQIQKWAFVTISSTLGILGICGAFQMGISREFHDRLSTFIREAPDDAMRFLSRRINEFQNTDEDTALYKAHLKGEFLRELEEDLVEGRLDVPGFFFKSAYFAKGDYTTGEYVEAAGNIADKIQYYRDLFEKFSHKYKTADAERRVLHEILQDRGRYTGTNHRDTAISTANQDRGNCADVAPHDAILISQVIPGRRIQFKVSANHVSTIVLLSDGYWYAMEQPTPMRLHKKDFEGKVRVDLLALAQAYIEDQRTPGKVFNIDNFLPYEKFGRPTKGDEGSDEEQFKKPAKIGFDDVNKSTAYIHAVPEDQIRYRRAEGVLFTGEELEEIKETKFVPIGEDGMDLSQLRGIDIENVEINGVAIKDLSALAGKELQFFFSSSEKIGDISGLNLTPPGVMVVTVKLFDKFSNEKVFKVDAKIEVTTYFKDSNEPNFKEPDFNDENVFKQFEDWLRQNQNNHVGMAYRVHYKFHSPKDDASKFASGAFARIKLYDFVDKAQELLQGYPNRRIIFTYDVIYEEEQPQIQADIPIPNFPISEEDLKEANATGRLVLTDNSATTLEQVRNLPNLQRVIIANTPIQSLEPLRGKRLRTVTLTGTKVTDLTPILENPPKVFIFDGETYDQLKAGKEILGSYYFEGFDQNDLNTPGLINKIFPKIEKFIEAEKRQRPRPKEAKPHGISIILDFRIEKTPENQKAIREIIFAVSSVLSIDWATKPENENFNLVILIGN